MLVVLEIWQLDASWQNESQGPCPADGGGLTEFRLSRI